jgi:hypothetical protein
MSSIEMRLAALELQFAELKMENETLKMSSKKVKTKAEKAENAEKNNTIPAVPSEWNVFVNSGWHEMAAVKGVTGEHDDAFKKASKEVGVTYQGAMKEASRRKAELEGRELVPKVKKEPKEKALKAASPKAPAEPVKASPKAPTPIKVPAPSPKAEVLTEMPSDADILAATPDYDDEMRVKMKAECEGYGWQARLINGIACWLDVSSGDVYSYDGINTIGIYDSESGEFCSTE